MSIGAPSPSTILPKPQTSNNNIFSLLPTSTFSLSNPIHTLPFPPKLHLKPSYKSPQFSSQPLYDAVSHDDDDEPAIGDCLVYEEGVFDDPFLHPTPNPNNQDADISPENLIPEKWLDVQKELNITKKERRKLSQQLEFGRKVERRRQELQPIDYEKFKYEKLKQLKPLLLDKVEPKVSKENESSGEEIRGRAAPRNPRLAVYGGGLEDIDHVFNSGSYVPGSADKSDGTRKLFSKEEKVLMNRRVPDLTVASSGKWHPLHTLAASGEFYLVNSLLKHNLDINALDKDGLAAIHKAILGKKQAIFNFLLRESANPFVRDEDGATLMHYAVRTASTQMIKILLLYSVDINLQDNDGWTPLHLAVQSRRTDIVRLLLIKGADKTLKNRDGLTALDICLNSGRGTRTYELIKLIKRLPR